MVASRHMQIAGILQLIQSSIFFQFCALFILRIWTDVRADSPDLNEYLGWASILVFVLTLVMGAGLLWFGVSLMRQRPWTTRTGGFLCCAPGLFVFPMVFSAYTLWVLLWVCRKNRLLNELSR